MRLNTEKKRQVIIIVSVVLLSFVILPLSVMAWETPIVIAGQAGHTYEKPEIRFAPGGAVYVVYRDKEGGGGNSDIYMCTYDGKEMTYENVSNTAQFFNAYKSYESDTDVTGDGRVHVAWMIHNRAVPNVHYIKYRYKDKNTWSDIIDMGTLIMRSGDAVFDLRLGVSNNGNVHILLQKEAETVLRYVAMYDGTITPVQVVGNPGARLKHPDIAVDNNYVHATWMRKIGNVYMIMYQKWENKLGGAWGTIRQVTFPGGGDYSCQKSRIDVDSDGFFHLLVFFKTGVIKKLRYTREMGGGALTPYLTISNPERLMLYHWATLEVRDNSIIATMQYGSSTGGFGIFYNWKKGNQWEGYAGIPNTEGPVHDSVDLSADGNIAAVAYARREDAIMLVSSEEISATGTLETQFTHPDMVFWGAEVTFDASQCAGLNPDYTIASYEWDFGDGHIETTSSPTVTHQFDTYGTDARVNLTITAGTGETGTFYKDIHINALYNGIITGVEKKQVRTLFHNRAANEVQWTANSKNAQAGYPSITTYEIWRAPQSSVAANTNSSMAKYGARTTPARPVSPAAAAINYVYVGEVGADVTTFLDYFGVQEGAYYIYSIRSVDSEGHKSPFDNF
jgi:hypothetical protein